MERESGKSFSQIGRENGVRHTTVMKCCRAGKDKIFKGQYNGMDQEIIIAPEDAMPRKANVENLRKENKSMKEELSFLRHKLEPILKH